VDPKFGRHLFEGKVIDDTFKDDHFYKVKCIVKDRLSEKATPHGLDRVLGEMIVLDGLTRDDEHVVIIAVHEARMLQMSLNAMNAVGIGYTSFTHYPTYKGETGAVRPKPFTPSISTMPK
jgi:hypothetical protein